MRMPRPATLPSVTESAAPAAAPAAGSSGRIAELDATRAMLMMLGVVLHAANPYATRDAWIVSDGNDQHWLEHLQRLPHEFRMAGFFLLAGFLGTLALQKRGVREFLGRRTTRLLYPLVTALLTINALQYWYVHHYIDTHCAPPATTCAAHATPGLWVAHLWFLFFLMGYSLLLPLLVRGFHWAPLRARLARTPLAHWPLTVAVMAPFVGALAIKAAAGLLPWLYLRLLGVGSLFDFCGYALYFALGVLIAGWPLLRQRFLQLPVRTALLLSAAGTAAYFAASRLYAAAPDARAAIVLDDASQALLTIGAVRLFMLLSRRLPGLATRIADSSYSVYLFHHFIVILLALQLTAWSGPSWAKFLLVVSVAGGGSYLIHRQLIARSRLLRLLFNGAG